MKVWRYQNGEVRQMASLLAALDLMQEHPACLSVVGGGGKTTTIEQLAREYILYHKRVAIAPTTKICVPKKGLVWDREEKTILTRGKGVVTIGIPQAGNKLGAVSEEFFQQICNYFPVVLMEADGSKGLPAKAPAGWEPVIRPETNVVLAIFGLDAIGKPLQMVCHRPELAAKILGKSLADPMTEEDAARLLSDRNGQKKGVMASMRYQIILNKADHPRLINVAAVIAHKLEERGVANTVIMKAKEEKNYESVD